MLIDLGHFQLVVSQYIYINGMDLVGIIKLILLNQLMRGEFIIYLEHIHLVQVYIRHLIVVLVYFLKLQSLVKFLMHQLKIHQLNLRLRLLLLLMLIKYIKNTQIY